MNRKKELLLALGCFLASFLLWFSQGLLEQRMLAGQIAPAILRFHVIANSNSRSDQEIKLKATSFLVEQINQEMDRRGEWGKEELKQYLLSSRDRLSRETEAFLRKQGVIQPVTLSIAWCEFPEKYYGSLTLPAGRYEAVQVKIGNGRGRNWWCVLYPRLCITKDAAAVMPETSMEKLKNLLSPEAYRSVTAQRPEIHPGLRLLSLIQNATQPAHPDR